MKEGRLFVWKVTLATVDYLMYLHYRVSRNVWGLGPMLGSPTPLPPVSCSITAHTLPPEAWSRGPEAAKSKNIPQTTNLYGNQIDAPALNTLKFESHPCSGKPITNTSHNWVFIFTLDYLPYCTRHWQGISPPYLFEFSFSRILSN